MGNGIYFRVINCCNTNRDLKKNDINIDNSQNGNYKSNNINTQNIIEEDTQNKNDKKIIVTKSKQSSGSDSFNKQKENNNPQMNNSNLMKNLLQNNINNSTKNSIEEYKYKNNNNNKIITKSILAGELFSDDKIEINKYGMKNGARQRNDGHTIFGIKSNENDDYDATNTIECDYYIHCNKIHDHNNIKLPGVVFGIFLDEKSKTYKLYYLHNTLILYYKINSDISLGFEKYYYIIIGEIFLTIKIKNNNHMENEKNINIQVEIENEKPKKYFFSQKEVPIKIGRLKCDINISNPSISKLHSIIDCIDDCYFYKDCGSKNGSTLLIREDDSLDIKGKMSFKLENISFKIKEVGNDDNYISEENLVE
jgi:hypothetical protein